MQRLVQRHSHKASTQQNMQAEAPVAPADDAAATPDATMRPAAAASAHFSAPVATEIQVAASVSTTLGGVPRVCRDPSTTCTAPKGGTRISTELPGAFSTSNCSK